MTGEQDFVITRRIDVVRTNLTLHETEEFPDHEDETVELLPSALWPCPAVDEDVSLQKTPSAVLIRDTVRGAKDDPEMLPEIRQCLSLGVEPEILCLTEHDLSTGREEGITEIPTDDVLEDLEIRGREQGSQEEDRGEEELLFPECEADTAVPGVQVMEGDRLPCLISPDTPNLGREFGVLPTTVPEAGADEGHDLVSPRLDDHTDDPFVPVHDEVTTEFSGFLLVLDELLTVHVFQPTQLRTNHDRNHPEIDVWDEELRMPWSLQDEGPDHLPFVGSPEFTAITRKESKL